MEITSKIPTAKIVRFGENYSKMHQGNYPDTQIVQ